MSEAVQHQDPTPSGEICAIGQSSAVSDQSSAVSDPAGEDRHAVVCAGAVKYLPDLRAFAGALAGNRHLADDLVQTAILRAIDAAQQFTPGTNFKAWIFTILRNASYNQWRSPASRQVALEETDGYAPVTPPTQDGNLEFCDFRRAFAQLVPEQREALLLIGASGLGYEEAAAICGCATGTVKSRVSRARTSLRLLMDGGSLELRRNDVVPISTLDLSRALQATGAALTRPTRRPPSVRPRIGNEGATAELPMPRAADIQPQPSWS
jgi:RNA polymerase sigma-70 factor (ECF subfamily)